jgi:hypothetical protein
MGRGVPEGLGGRVVEGFLVAHDVGVADRSEDADLVDCVVDLAVGQVHQLHLLECVDRLVHQPLHLVHA